MDFPVLFEDEPEREEEKAPLPPNPVSGLAVPASPPPPSIEVIGDSNALRKALDKPHPIVALGRELLSQGFINQGQLDRAIRIQSGSSKTKRIGEILVETGAVSRETVDFVLARRLGLPTVDLHKLDIEPDALRIVPKFLAGKHLLMPCMIHRKRLVAAVENPADHAALKPVEFACGMPVLGVLAPKKDIEWAIDHYYRTERDRSPIDYWR